MRNRGFDCGLEVEGEGVRCGRETARSLGRDGVRDCGCDCGGDVKVRGVTNGSETEAELEEGIE